MKGLYRSIFAVAFACVLGVGMATAQGSLGKGRSGGSGSGGSKEPPKRQSSPPKRQSSPPQRQSSPPQRQSSPPQRQSSPPQRQSSPPDNSGRRTLPPRGTSSSSQSTPPPQNRERNEDRGGYVDLLGRGRTQSGSGAYGSNHNINSAESSRDRDQRDIGSPPPVVRNGQLAYEARREGEAERNFDRDRWYDDNSYRSGYYWYDNGWYDDRFYYPNYYFRYDPVVCVASPFYFYSHLPGYIGRAHIRIGDFGISFPVENRYRYRRPSYNVIYSDRYSALDYAVSDIEYAFEQRDMRFLERVLPRQGEVYIELDEFTRYYIGSNDYYNLMYDLVELTETTDYDIEDVFYEGDRATVIAVHEYRDGWGGNERAYHTYVLEREGRGFEVVYFSVGLNRPRYR